jgi:hypothetical protein
LRDGADLVHDVILSNPSYSGLPVKSNRIIVDSISSETNLY